MLPREVIDRLAVGPGFDDSLSAAERIRGVRCELVVVMGSLGGEVSQHKAEHVATTAAAEAMEEAAPIEAH